MNQFTTETIVNSTGVFAKSGTQFIAKKIFAFDKANITAVFKKAAEAETPQKVRLTITNDGDASKVYRLHVVLKSVDCNPSDFQNALTRNRKEFNAEVKGLGKAVMAASLAKVLTKMTTPNPKFTVTNPSGGSAILDFTAIDGFTRFEKVELLELVPNPIAKEEVIVLDVATELTPGVSGFGTANWILRNLRLPTIVNTNWLATHQDERPIPGELYDQYTFHVEVDRGELTGMGAVGQKMTSKTTHVLYVREGAPTSEIDTILGSSGSGLNITVTEVAPKGKKATVKP